MDDKWPRETTQKGNLKRPSLSTVCEWVVKSWSETPAEMVAQSFLKCGISNSMDGTDDDILFEDFSSEKCDAESCDSDGSFVYGDGLSDKQISELFRSDDEESDFEGF